jgi:hypothetical protein
MPIDPNDPRLVELKSNIDVMAKQCRDFGYLVDLMRRGKVEPAVLADDYKALRINAQNFDDKIKDLRDNPG